MSRTIALHAILILSLTFLILGCGKSEPAEPEASAEELKKYEDANAVLNETLEILKTVQDEASADAAAPKLEQIAADYYHANRVAIYADPAMEQNSELKTAMARVVSKAKQIKAEKDRILMMGRQELLFPLHREPEGESGQ